MKIDGGLRGIFRQHLPFVHWQSVETALTGSGVPDSNACYLGVEWWVEYKQTTTDKIKLNKTIPFQVAWHERRNRAGGRTFVAVRRVHKNGSDDLFLYRGALARDVLMGNGLKNEAWLYWGVGGPTCWHWDLILNDMVGKVIRWPT